MEKSQLPIVSILCPIYNAESYVGKCVQSLFSQTYENLEFVFVDDKCTDNSIAIIQQTLEKYPERKSNVQILHHAKNRGQAAGRNTALAACKGDFLMFVDSDDWIEPNSVELLVTKQQETDADIVYGQLKAHFPSREEVWAEPQYANKKEMVIHAAELTIDHSLCKRIFRRSLFVDHQIACVEGLDYGEDHLLMPQLLWYANNVARIEDVIYHYNCWKDGAVSYPLSTIWKMWSSELNVMDALIAFFSDKDEDFMVSLNKTKADCLMNCLGQAFAQRTRHKYNELASLLYSMPSIYFERVKFERPVHKCLYRYYDIRLGYRAIIKVISAIKGLVF